MDQGQDEGWRPTNLFEGVERQFATADSRIRLAAIVGGIWGFLLLAVAAYQFRGGMGIGYFEWNVGAGLAALMMSLGAASRNLLATALLAALCVGELPALALTVGRVLGDGGLVDQVVAAVRIAFLPAVLYNGIQGYVGAYEYQRLRRPHSARSWRAVNPSVLKGSIYSAMGSIVIGFAIMWSSYIMQGFSQPGAPVTHVRPAADRVAAGAASTATAATRDAESVVKKKEPSGEDGAVKGPGEEKKDAEQDPAAAAPGNDAGGSPLLRHEIELKGPAYAAAQEAMGFARKSDNVGCLNESLRRHEACKDEECRHLAGVFVTACLPESKPTEGFCSGVPSMLSVIETNAWRTRLCVQGVQGAPGKAAADAQPCHAFYANLQAYCHPEDAEKAKAAASAKK